MTNNIDMNKVQRINFTLNPKNDLDFEVLQAIEKLKDEGYNVSARIKKLLINDANGIVSTSNIPVTNTLPQAPANNTSLAEDNDASEDEGINLDEIEVDMDNIMGSM